MRSRTIILLDNIAFALRFLANIKIIVTQLISLDKIAPSHRSAATTCNARKRGRPWIIAGVVDDGYTSTLRVTVLPVFDIVVLHSGIDGAVENDACDRESSAQVIRVSEAIVPKSDVFDEGVEEGSVARVAHFVLFNFRTVRLYAVRVSASVAFVSRREGADDALPQANEVIRDLVLSHFDLREIVHAYANEVEVAQRVLNGDLVPRDLCIFGAGREHSIRWAVLE